MCPCNRGNRYRDYVNIFLEPNFVSPDHESRCSLNTGPVPKEKFHCMSSKHYNIIRCYKQQKWALKNKFVHLCLLFFCCVNYTFFVFWVVIFVFHSVWWQLPLFEYDKFGDTAPLTVYYLICTVTNYVKVHHRSYRGNFCSCKKKAWKNCTGFELLTSAIPVQRSYLLS